MAEEVCHIWTLPIEILSQVLSLLDQPAPSQEDVYDDPAAVHNDDYDRLKVYREVIERSNNNNNNNNYNNTTTTTTTTTTPDVLASLDMGRQDTTSLPAQDLPEEEGQSSEQQASPHGTPRCPHNLKNASLVCRLWRRLLLKLLFRHLSWAFQAIRRPDPIAQRRPETILQTLPELDWLRFLLSENLAPVVRTLTITIDYPLSAVRHSDRHTSIAGILPHGTLRPKDRCNDWLWSLIFNAISPNTITIIAAPAVLAAILGRTIDLSNAALVQQRFHILSLSLFPHQRSTSPPYAPPSDPSLGAPPDTNTVPDEIAPTTANASAQTPTPPEDTTPCNLFTIRPWLSLLINEGSSAKAYSTPNYFNYSTPTILPSLLDPSDPSAIPMFASLESFSYIAIFPISTHIDSILIPNIPKLHRFYIQIVPRDINFIDFTQTRHRHRHPAIDFNDFWVERNSCYSLIAMAVFEMSPLGNWKHLRIYESGDSADLEAWEKAVRFVVYNGGLSWQVSSKGVFIRSADPVTQPSGSLVSSH